MSAIEAELVKATKFKGAKFDDRQEYLRALLNVIDSKLSNEAYDNLTEEAVDWHTKAVKAHDTKQDIPEFDDAETEEAEEAEEAEDQDETEEADEEPPEQDELPLTSPKHPLHRKPKVTEEPEEPDDDETNNAEAVDAADEPAVETDEDDGQGEKPPAKAAKPKAKGKTVKEAKPFKKPKRVIDYNAIYGEKDRYGIVKGTKTAEAVKLYEKGVTSAQLMDELGGRHYNVLARLSQQGHKIEKLQGGVWKVTHKDDIKKKSK